LIKTNKPMVAFLEGHGELEPQRVFDLAQALQDHYVVQRFNLRQFPVDSTTGQPSILKQLTRLNRFQALIIAKPTQSFTDLDKWLIDQFIMKGGKTLWLLDAVAAEMDSLSKAPNFLAYPLADQLRIGDQLFRYGVRINTNLAEDLVCAGVSDMRSVRPWVYFPLLIPQTKHPIVKGLNAVKTEFLSTLDTIKSPGIRKTILLRTSPYTRISATPTMVELRALYEEPDESRFNTGYLPVAMLLEGSFESAFKNRITPQDQNGQPLPFLEDGQPTQIFVMADGDVVRNQINLLNTGMPRGTPLPLGYDQYTGVTYGNKNFLLNVIDYMLDDSGLIDIRTRELKIRILDSQKIQGNTWKWALVNTLIPLGLVGLAGLLWMNLRRKRYAA
jgi:ABC-2 type transport system permease protein